MQPNRQITQPGPALLPRTLAVPCHVVERHFTLPPGAVVLDALQAELGDRSAVLHLSGGAFGPFTYVIPALSLTPEHAAFYSDARTPPGDTRLDAARITYGTREGRPWLHCHGFWTLANGTQDGGHVIPDLTQISQPIAVQAWVLTGAHFTARPDPETNFTIFGPQPDGDSDGENLALRLRPNQDFCTTLEDLCTARGITHATLRGGVASIIGAVFDDGRTLDAFATEIFITEGRIAPGIDGRPKAEIDIALVNYQGALATGRLKRGANPVLMTAELLLQPHLAKDDTSAL